MKISKEEKQEMKQEKKSWNQFIRRAMKKDALIEGDFVKSIYNKNEKKLQGTGP